MGQDYIVRKGDTISSIAKKFGVSLKALKAANPQIKNFDLIRTGEKINIPTVPGPINLVGQTYVVQPGDTISNIADQFGVSVEDLEAANPRFKNFDLIQPGDVLNIPDSPGVVPVNLVGQTYVVQPGDTISNIADQFGVSVEDLEAANPTIKNFDLIQPGDVINIPDSPGVVPVNLVGQTYVVKPGDTFSSIADQFGVSVEDLEAANPQIKNFDLIHPGDVINVPTSDTKSELGPGATPQLVHFKNEIESGSKTAKVPVDLIAGMIWQESRANPNASSNHGKDTGLMQINDDTFNDMRKNHPIIGSHKNDPATNILGGSFYLSEMYSQFGDYPLALRAYNSGPESVDPKDPNKTGGVGDPNYVRNVLKFEKIIATGNGKLDP